MPDVCPLCQERTTAEFAVVDGRRYQRCRHCDLTFLEPSQRPSAVAERAEYDLHQNQPHDPRYRRHLAKLTEPLLRNVPPGAEGLDFGSGPGPTIAVMLGEQGFRVWNYDPFFAPDRAVLERRYDFITCTETAEHFHEPAREFSLFQNLLRPGGQLGIMTTMLTEGIDFQSWWYRREISHVSFYSPKTFDWIGRRHGWSTTIHPPDVVIFEAMG